MFLLPLFRVPVHSGWPPRHLQAVVRHLHFQTVGEPCPESGRRAIPWQPGPSRPWRDSMSVRTEIPAAFAPTSASRRARRGGSGAAPRPEAEFAGKAVPLRRGRCSAPKSGDTSFQAQGPREVRATRGQTPPLSPRYDRTAILGWPAGIAALAVAVESTLAGFPNRRSPAALNSREVFRYLMTRAQRLFP